MDLLLDTHILIWTATKPEKLSANQRAALADADNRLFVSAVAAFEYAHLQEDGRLPTNRPFADVQELIGFQLLDLPAGCWRMVADLPMIHRDPIDRMMIAHCLVSEFVFMTADKAIRRYPVEVI